MDDLLVIDGVSKTYGSVKACQSVSLRISKGEVHALLGENGAGKSTLVKMIYGLVSPDAGNMQFLGAEFVPSEPRAARRAGVAMVFQHFSLFDAMSVAENIALGMEEPPKPHVLEARITEMSTAYGLQLDPKRIVGDLSAGERQRVEIIRCLLQDPKLLIMDEPTSVLTPQEVDVLFETLRKISAQGTGILYISHKLDEIRTLCDNATILRGGKVVGTCVPQDETPKSMAEMMVGTGLSSPKKTAFEPGEVLLKMDDITAKSPSEFGMDIKGVSLELRAGEVLGVGGIAGNGQDELTTALSGEVAIASGRIYFEGQDISHMGPNERRELGLLTAPEERLGHAAVPDMSLTENALLTGYTRKDLGNNGFIDWSGSKGFAVSIIEAFDVRTPGPWQAAKALSGGNLQKFVVGREIAQEPRVFIVNQPTWGVDAAAAASIRTALLDLAANGAGVLVISQDLDELIEISDTLAILSEGRLSEPQLAEGVQVEDLGLLMGGSMAQ